MSLVAYGSSDSEEETEVQDESISISDETLCSEVNKDRIKDVSESVEQFSEKGVKVQNEEISGTLTTLPKKQREAVRITLPSLDQFKDEDADSEPRKKPQFKSGSGLFSILPPPKNTCASTTHGFTPYILTKQKEKNKPSVSSHIKKETVIQDVPSSVSHISKVISDSSDTSILHETEQNYIADSSSKIDYFSLDTPNMEIGAKFTEIGTNSTSTLFSSLPEPSKSSTSYSSSHFIHQNPSAAYMSNNEDYKCNESSLPQVEVSCPSPIVNEACTESSGDASFINDKEFLKIKGRRKEEINIVDVNADEQLTGKNEWLMQSLTEERVERPSKRRHDMPTQQQKRKHQITYLAFRAKERELDLKNQWAMNSLTRRETQAKYGF